MRSTQTKFMAAVEKAAIDYGMEFIQDQQYANTGWVTIQFEDSFEPVVRFSYSFQTGNNVDAPYATFQGAIGITNPKGSDPDSWHYVLQPELEAFIKTVRNALAVAVQQRQAAEFAK